MDYRRRQQTLQSELEHRRLDAMLITHLPNIRYLCGFTGSAAALLISEKQTVFFTDGRYNAQARAEVHASRIIIARKAPLVAAEWLQANRKRLGMTGKSK